MITRHVHAQQSADVDAPVVEIATKTQSLTASADEDSESALRRASIVSTDSFDGMSLESPASVLSEGFGEQGTARARRPSSVPMLKMWAAALQNVARPARQPPLHVVQSATTTTMRASSAAPKGRQLPQANARIDVRRDDGFWSAARIVRYASEDEAHMSIRAVVQMVADVPSRRDSGKIEEIVMLARGKDVAAHWVAEAGAYSVFDEAAERLAPLQGQLATLAQSGEVVQVVQVRGAQRCVRPTNDNSSSSLPNRWYHLALAELSPAPKPPRSPKHDAASSSADEKKPVVAEAPKASGATASSSSDTVPTTAAESAPVTSGGSGDAKIETGSSVSSDVGEAKAAPVEMIAAAQ